MDWETSLATHHMIWIAALPVSALLTIGLAKLFRIPWMAALLAAPVPALGVIVWFFYREAQQPVGPFLAIVGIWHAGPALLSGAAGAAVTAFFVALRDDGSIVE